MHYYLSYSCSAQLLWKGMRIHYTNMTTPTNKTTHLRFKSEIINSFRCYRRQKLNKLLLNLFLIYKLICGKQTWMEYAKSSTLLFFSLFLLAFLCEKEIYMIKIWVLWSKMYIRHTINWYSIMYTNMYCMFHFYYYWKLNPRIGVQFRYVIVLYFDLCLWAAQ